MASVFLSYDHEDSARAAPIAAALESNGHSVWWDRHIHSGAEFNNAIEAAVESADAVVVLWSANSVQSAWVRDEAGEGRDRGKLVPILIGPVKPPMGFRQYQTLDLAGWNGGKRIPRLDELLRAINAVAGTDAKAPPTFAPLPSHDMRGSPYRSFSRRTAVAGAGAAILALGAGATWWSMRKQEDPRFEALMDQASDQMRRYVADENTAKLLERAAAIQPNSAEAWGKLALMKSFLTSGPDAKDPAQLVDESEKAARRALSLDPKQPDALLAMFDLQGSTLDWITRDRKLRHIVAIAPQNFGALDELGSLTAATGMVRESWQWNERSLAIEPLSPTFLGRRALKLWVFGRTSEADKVSDQLRALDPANPFAWFVRVQLYAFTGRIRAALSMLRDSSAIPPISELWRASLAAFDDPSPAKLAQARNACVRAVQTSPVAANEAILVMSGLGELDTAFDIADGTLLSRGPLVPPERPGSGGAAADAGWRINTQWMWVPPVAKMRADARFLPLCESIGLTDYWKQRGVRPDYMRA